MFTAKQQSFFCDESDSDSDDNIPLYVDRHIYMDPQKPDDESQAADLLSDLAIPLPPSKSDDHPYFQTAQNSLAGLSGLDNNNDSHSDTVSTHQSARVQEGPFLAYVRRTLAMPDNSVGGDAWRNSSSCQPTFPVARMTTPSPPKTANRQSVGLNLPKSGLCRMLFESQQQAISHSTPLGHLSIVLDHGLHSRHETDSTSPVRGPHKAVSSGNGSSFSFPVPSHVAKAGQLLTERPQTENMFSIVEELITESFNGQKGAASDETDAMSINEEKCIGEDYDTDVDAMRAFYGGTPLTRVLLPENKHEKCSGEMDTKWPTGDDSNLQSQGCPNENKSSESSGYPVHLLRKAANATPPPNYVQHMANVHPNWPEQSKANCVLQGNHQPPAFSSGRVVLGGMIPCHMYYPLTSLKATFNQISGSPVRDKFNAKMPLLGESKSKHFSNVSMTMQQNQPQQNAQESPLIDEGIQNWRPGVQTPEFNHQTKRGDHFLPNGKDISNHPNGQFQRARTTFSHAQTDVLENEFRSDTRVGKMRKTELSKMLNLPEKQIEKWFKHHRKKNSLEGLTGSHKANCPRERMVGFTPQQIYHILNNKSWETNTHIGQRERRVLSQALDIPEGQVEEWFMKHQQIQKHFKDLHKAWHPVTLRELTEEQTDILKREFQRSSYIQGVERLELSRRVNLTEAQVSSWFHSRRRQKKRMDDRAEAKSRNALPPGSTGP